MKDITTNQWKEKIASDPSAMIIDVRTPAEFNGGIIPNAVNIDISNWHLFLEKLSSMDKQKSYLVYCRSGMRSAQAMMLMNQLGFADVSNLIGGLMAWDESLVRPTVSQTA